MTVSNPTVEELKEMEKPKKRESLISGEMFHVPEEVKLPEALVNIEGFAFYRNKLTKVEFGSKVKRLEPSSFAMNELTEITFPETLEYIGASAFFKNSLETVSFPKSVTKIDMYAFRKNNIHKVEVANSVDLHKFAFETFTTVERF